MSRASRTRPHATDATPPADLQPPDDARAVAAFLRSLARRVEGDPVFATHIAAVLRESGLLTALPTANLEAASRAGAGRRAAKAEAAFHDAAVPDAAASPDPYALLRAHGEAGLRTALEALDLSSLRAIVRSHRLDPARISARWTTRDRVIGLIITQVQARANLGKAFSRV
ncbi:MAG: hypothetical protein ACXWQ5_11030 [Ktedonobacterales bacterium]